MQGRGATPSFLVEKSRPLGFLSRHPTASTSHPTSDRENPALNAPQKKSLAKRRMKSYCRGRFERPATKGGASVRLPAAPSQAALPKLPRPLRPRHPRARDPGARPRDRRVHARAHVPRRDHSGRLLRTPAQAPAPVPQAVRASRHGVLVRPGGVPLPRRPPPLRPLHRDPRALQARQRRRLAGGMPPAPSRHTRVDPPARAAPRLGRDPPPPTRRPHPGAGTAAGDLDHARLEALARPKARIPSRDRPLVHRRAPRGRGQARARAHAQAATHVPAQPRPRARPRIGARPRRRRAEKRGARIPSSRGAQRRGDPGQRDKRLSCGPGSPRRQSATRNDGDDHAAGLREPPAEATPAEPAAQPAPPATAPAPEPAPRIALIPYPPGAKTVIKIGAGRPTIPPPRPARRVAHAAPANPFLAAKDDAAAATPSPQGPRAETTDGRSDPTPHGRAVRPGRYAHNDDVTPSAPRGPPTVPK